MIRIRRFVLPLVALMALLSGSLAHADRITFGFGIAHLNVPSGTNFELGAEYEHTLDPLFGIGAFGNYIFSSPGVTLLGFPSLYLHPFAGDFLVSASPIVEFGSGIATYFGARLGTRVPIPLGAVTIIPSFAVDFIAGGQNYIFGLGIGL